MNRWLLLFFMLVSLGSVSAQKTDEGGNLLVDYEGDGAPPAKGYRSQFNIEVSAPHYFLNAANSQAFNGIVQANIWYSLKVHKNFYMGPYFRYTGFEYYAG